MYDSVAILAAVTAEKRLFEQELDRKSQWYDCLNTPYGRDTAGPRWFGRLVVRMRQLKPADRANQPSAVAEQPAGC